MKFTKRLLLPAFISVSFSALAQNDARVQAYIEKYKDLAILEQKRTGIPAAIKLAQGIHETAAGTSELCQNANNHFGIKCKATWNGETYTYTDDRKDECFRKYGDDITSYKDHSDFLYKNPRYSTLFTYSVDDYKSWSHGLKKAGYATNPQYAVRLIETIEKYNLNQYTQIAMLSKEPEVLYASNSQDIKMVMPGETPGETNVAAAAIPATAVYASGKSTVQQERNIEYYTTGQLNNIRGFYAPKGTMLLEYAIKNRIRYSKLLENNDLPDAPLEADMFIYLDKKHKKGLEPTTTVQEGESLIQISQRTGVQLAQLKMFNKLVDGVEPKPGSVLQLQSEAANAPEVYIPSSGPVAAVPLARKANAAEDAYVVVKNNSQAGSPEPTPYKQQPAPATNTTTSAPAPAKNPAVPVQQPVAAVAATTKAPEVIEDNSNLSPYERLKRHMDKQVSNTTSYNETRIQETNSSPAAEDPYVTTPARTTTQPAARQAPSRQSTSNTAQPKAAAGNRFHTVKKGETLTAIAQKYGVTVKQLQDWNKVSPKTLKAGQKLKVSK